MNSPLDFGQPVDAPAVILTLVVRLTIAALFGVVIAITRTYSQNDTKPSPGFRTTLVLLTVLTALVTEVIGNNIARAFGLAGALAVVRFRTVMEDTRDSAFVIFAMATGMAIGAGYFWTAAVGVPIVSTVALLARFIGGAFPESRAIAAKLELRYKPSEELDRDLMGMLSKYFHDVKQTEYVVGKEETVDATFTMTSRPDFVATAIVTELKSRTGMEKVRFVTRG
ncbi:MAG: DUF4956 domain-containing protein [Gemmataceae bacterium]